MTWRDKISYVSLLITVLAIFYICAFKIVDRDFWWHIKAGEIMSTNKRLITVEPFSYTREGKQYISTHEWLAQVLMYHIYDIGGATGTIIWRSIAVFVAFALLLLIDPKTIWPNFFIVLIAAYMHRRSLMDRPSLFTYIFFCYFLWAATYYLRRLSIVQSLRESWRSWIVISLFLTQVLWVNMHGAVAVFGLAIILALLADQCVEWILGGTVAVRKIHMREMRYLGFLLLLLGVASFISPNSWHILEFLFVYSYDPTLQFVPEWFPRPFPDYIRELGLFWVISFGSIFLGKRHILFSVIVLLINGYLSLQASRHGIMFVFVALAVTFYQLRHSKLYQQYLERITKKPIRAFAISAVIMGMLGFYVYSKDIGQLQRPGLYGYGVRYFAKDAVDFLEKNNINGRMFNTGGIGGYLLNRGYPNRKIAIDGRNFDYGYEFMHRMILAASSPDEWQKLEVKYQFTYAIIETGLRQESLRDGLSYVGHLGKNMNWNLVYLDDDIAIYLKNTEENKKNIVEYGYRLITPEGLELGSVFEGLKDSDIKTVEQELERASKSAPKSIKASLILSHHYVQAGNLEKAQAFAEAAIDAQPYRPEAYEALGAVAVAMKQWAQAGAILEKSIKLTGGVGLPINYNYLAGIFSNAGDVAKSSYYRQKAK